MLIAALIFLTIGLVLCSYIGWRYRMEIRVVIKENPKYRDAILWSILAVVYVALLVLGGYWRWGNLMLTVSVIFAIIAVIGKKSLDQFGEKAFHQVVEISLLVVAIASWIWPTLAMVAVLPVVFTCVWALNVMPDRWTEFASTWGRKAVYRFTWFAAIAIVICSLFKLSFEITAKEVVAAKVRIDAAVAAWVKNPVWPDFGSKDTSPTVSQPASAPASMPASKQPSPASKPAKLNQNWPAENIGVVGHPPTVDEVVSGKAKPLAAPPATSPAAKPAPADEDAVQKELREAFSEDDK